MQQRGLDEALRTALSGMREESDLLAAQVERLEQERLVTREEFEHHRLLADAVERELIRRGNRQAAKPALAAVPAQSAPAPAPDTAPDTAGGARHEVPAPEAPSSKDLSPDEVKALRGPSRRDVAIQVLDTLGRQRPVRARDVAERYGHGTVDKAGREGARSALVALAALGRAVRLDDGTYVPVDAQPQPTVSGAVTVGSEITGSN